VITKRSVKIAGHSTSVSLEEEFWNALQSIARRRKQSLASLIASADDKRAGNLSSTLRLLVLDSYKKREII
jgi:predicted DNA-binding ribbon-helix-helix protein